MMRPEIGQRFGRLTILTLDHYDQGRRAYFVCLCDCGNRVVRYGSHMIHGRSLSCGCLAKENGKLIGLSNHKHGESSIKNTRRATRLYKIWGAMHRRCERPNDWQHWHRYGGRGIRVCAEWKDFTVFRSWALSHGYRDDLTIDRIDNDGDYEPGNCQWLTLGENSHKARLEEATA